MYKFSVCKCILSQIWFIYVYIYLNKVIVWKPKTKVQLEIMILKGKRSHVVIAKANVRVICWPISELKKILIPGPLLSLPKRVKFSDSGLGAPKCVCFKSSLWYWYIVCIKIIVWKNRRKMPTLGYTENWTLQIYVHGCMCACICLLGMI